VNLHELPERLRRIKVSEKFEFLEEVDKLIWTRLKNLERQMDEVKEHCNEVPPIRTELEQLLDNLDGLVFSWLFIFYSIHTRNDFKELADEMAIAIEGLDRLEKEWQRFLEKYFVGIIFV